MTKRATEYDLLIQAREGAVKSAAEMLRTIAEMKQVAGPPPAVRCADPGRPESPIGGKGDLLYELLQLHFEYVNSLAKIQSSYGDLARRTVERLYSLVVPPSCTESRLVFVHRDDDTHEVVVRNDCACSTKLEISWTPLRSARPSRAVEDALQVLVGARQVSASDHREIEAGERVTLRVRVVFGLLDKHKHYQSEIRIRVGAQARTLKVLVKPRLHEAD